MNPFDAHADRYDAWFDSPTGAAIFGSEVRALEPLVRERPGRWLEVGVGSGRFAQALAITEGVDPSAPALAYARRRGVVARQGRAEALPFEAACFDGLLLVVTICFLDDPAAALAECRRVLVPGGRLVLGLVPADSPWGQRYQAQRASGHRFYSIATFYTSEQVNDMMVAAGFVSRGASSCLFSSPTEAVDPSVRVGAQPGAGFVGMAFERVD